MSSTHTTHAAQPKVGVLLLNIGSPDAPRALPVRRYLAEFLGDPRIVELPRWLWQPLLHGIVINVRAFRSARVYRRIWRAEGSPLVHFSERIAGGLERLLAERTDRRISVALAMRYGQPDIDRAFEGFHKAGVDRVLVLPLHPQYCASTVGSAFDGVTAALARRRWVPEFRFVSGYHDHPGYVAALAASVREHWREVGERRHLLLSFHSIPAAYARKGDPYPEQVNRTSELLARALGLDAGQWSVGFQSRFMAGRWLEPTTETMLDRLAATGVRRVSVISPVFPTDCLETLDDLVIRASAHFLRAGGERLDVVPALNDAPAHLEFLADLVQSQTSGWLASASGASAQVVRLAG